MPTTGRSSKSMLSSNSIDKTLERRSRSRLLHRRILLQALRDYASGNLRAHDEVRRWLVTDDFKLVCGEADVDWLKMGKAILSMDNVPTEDRSPMIATVKSLLGL